MEAVVEIKNLKERGESGDSRIRRNTAASYEQYKS